MRLIFKPFINSSVLVLLLRVIIGIVFFMHGSQKVFGWFGGHGLEATINGFGKFGIPPFLAYTASLAEFLGGIFILLGFMTRIFALGIVIDMAVAIFTVHLKNGFFAPTGFEFPLVLLTSALGIFLLGAGTFSIDEFLAKRYRRTHVSEDGGLRTEYKANYRS
ncbi:MAG: DoxX family protein [Bacteroidota bacterium]|nr:DoxX family protein [Bacteroidota bacterium]MDP4191237.1 DoxX family protein [Bacteroidota bacterium]MDP4193609.1 DoxX family protein [Bacteroidota bacterium]